MRKKAEEDKNTKVDVLGKDEEILIKGMLSRRTLNVLHNRLSSKMECDRASSGGERQAAESNAALGGEKRRKRWRVTEKVVEEQQSNGGEQ
ncbi:unnamed protein product [Brassica napus]|uniref:(rape) hypothetical protein n=1 Tax=Brassica napus TaxID=3708 RepID=A0A816JYQ4_BRANA|nr:unnamed protein product [Brassica napus]